MSLSTIRLDPWGDLTLRIGPDGATDDYIVCPRTLARASPVFERMLYGGFAEREPSTGAAVGEWIVRLPEDNSITMGLFLSMIHGNYDETLQDLSLDEIYHLTVVVHYYDATKVLRPWAEIWINHVASLVEDVNTPMLRVLWIAWELGSISLFRIVSRHILLEFDAADFEDSLSCSSTQTPPGVLEHIHSVRENVLCSLLQPFKDLISHLLVENEKPRWCRHAVWMGPHRCESIILGSLTWCLCKSKLWPLPEAPDIYESIAAIYTRLSGLIIHDLGQFDKKEDHSICNPSGMINLHMKTALTSLTLPLTRRQIEYMRKQKHILDMKVSYFKPLLSDKSAA
ncbi:hypothetical protein BHYA_0240g00120 [Botrytis hyacinthi]|uniref:BTB domain-containing protein n=1 Tax=Botrytis hyacinthi TaxID=278943 RepID=A0A4Z1GHV2_9HELO|nr:hypothetical protein BHYA_0240g00120 [Botrytis hyacinthi]